MGGVAVAASFGYCKALRFPLSLAAAFADHRNERPAQVRLAVIGASTDTRRRVPEYSNPENQIGRETSSQGRCYSTVRRGQRPCEFPARMLSLFMLPSRAHA